MELRWASLRNFLEDGANQYGEKIAFSHFENGQWRLLDYRTVLRLSLDCARGMRRSGHQKGDRVAILSNTSLDFPIQFFGTVLSGAVAVPIDPKLSPAEILTILRHLEPRTLVVSSEFQALGFHLQAELGLEKLLRLEPMSGLTLSDEEPKELGLTDTAAIYYTSGTLGQAKGVMVSLESILFELTALTSLNENHSNDVIFSILPLNHLYGMTAGVLYSMACGAEYVFAHSLAPQDIALCLKDRKVTQMSVVPLLLNLLRRGIQKRFQEQPRGKRILLAAFLALGPFLPITIRRKLFGTVHEKLGGRLRRSVSGAAPLDPATYRFFQAIGAPIYEGYGLTETGPVLSVNHTRQVKAGTVGKPLAGVEIKIEREISGEPGEILARGKNLMQGYFRAPELTREVLSEDGWFRTGDIGTFERGFLRITGRKKSLIVLESGKKVHAEEIEQAIAVSPHFQDVCVLGLTKDAGEQVVAVVLPSPEYFAALGENAEEAANAEIQKLCKKIAPYKRPARIIIRREAFPKTSSGKVKRHLVALELRADTT